MFLASKFHVMFACEAIYMVWLSLSTIKCIFQLSLGEVVCFGFDLVLRFGTSLTLLELFFFLDLLRFVAFSLSFPSFFPCSDNLIDTPHEWSIIVEGSILYPFVSQKTQAHWHARSLGCAYRFRETLL